MVFFIFLLGLSVNVFFWLDMSAHTFRVALNCSIKRILFRGVFFSEGAVLIKK